MKQLSNFTPFSFQAKTISDLLEIISTNGGACQFCETGLGKTITAATVAINMDTENILVVAPTAQQNIWRNVLPFADVCGYQTIPNKKYDFIIVDEAHNYKNRKSQSYKMLWNNIFSSDAKVLLLTATPFSNKLAELQTMLSLIPFEINSAAFLQLGNLFNKATKCQKVMDNIERYEEGEVRTFGDITKYGKATFEFDRVLVDIKKVMQTFCIRNTRAFISTEYKSDLDLIGCFPKVTYNDKLEVIKNNSFGKLFHQTTTILDSIPLCRQNLHNYISTDNNLFLGMGGIFKSLCFKRMDSSISAFKSTIKSSCSRLVELKSQYSSNVLNGIELVKGDFWGDLEKDMKGFESIIKLWENESDVDKLSTLIEQINSADGKVVVFTEYKDTLNIIEEALITNGTKYLKFSSDNKQKDLDVIAKEFDANSEKKTDKVKVLICTDILAEGVNLHRAKTLIHFDSKWNPSKTIQREGRINRIIVGGNTNNVDITSFRTNVIIEQIIKLEDKIEYKSYLSNVLLDNLEYNPVYMGNKFEFENKKRYFLKDGEKGSYVVVKGEYEDFLVNNHPLADFMKTNKDVISKIDLSGAKIELPREFNKLSRELKQRHFNFHFNIDDASMLYMCNHLYYDNYYDLAIANIISDANGRILGVKDDIKNIIPNKKLPECCELFVGELVYKDDADFLEII